ncbi:peptide chain release factor 2 [Brachyspira aalborgi]|uniref:Peptide chain release factor 2 n=1 Tax=Brachyspira aalborgi TaxID=29522 RepID=A0AB38PW77_9SPIR|nr:peptide chain release factor 2 [Brachyspira aalborgi]TXJ18075.1 peptide chain release factor 2 [Brachyspira aalborgi]TXJ24030.1 peptide chain release factor 2 [Brachyspira aalborgi]TXJ47817.1 peptide chain release factor 2 [Brachyspira aalborgi]
MFDPESIYKRVKEIDEISAKDDFWSDNISAQKLMKERMLLLDKIEPVDNLIKNSNNIYELTELAINSNDNEMESELESECLELQKVFEELETKNLFSGEFDSKNAYLTLNAGAGGTESCDWASMLSRMYVRFCERHGWTVETTDELPGDEAGIKQISFYIQGLYAYGYLRSEIGVHRLVRISPFDANAKRHTSFVAVSVMPDIDEDIEVDINQADLRIDTYRASGAGGQHVNKTSSAIRITHIPTNIVVQCQAERSQHNNKDMAMKMLKAKLYQLEKEKLDKEKQKIAGEKTDIAWGNQIRSYVFQPYQLVKDLRTGYESGNMNSVMDGNIDEFISAYLKWKIKK